MLNAKIGPFKPSSDFDWSWPTKIDRRAIKDLFCFESLGEAANVVLLGFNGLGKTTVAQNLAHPIPLDRPPGCYPRGSAFYRADREKEPAMVSSYTSEGEVIEDLMPVLVDRLAESEAVSDVAEEESNLELDRYEVDSAEATSDDAVDFDARVWFTSGRRSIEVRVTGEAARRGATWRLGPFTVQGLSF